MRSIGTEAITTERLKLDSSSLAAALSSAVVFLKGYILRSETRRIDICNIHKSHVLPAP